MKILIWNIRAAKGITLKELSKATQISKSALSNYENQKRYPNIDVLERIAVALECRITDLFDSEYK